MSIIKSSATMRNALFIVMMCGAYVLHAQNLETVIQKGHDQTILTVKVSRDSNYVVTGSRDKSAKLWQLSSKREVRAFIGHEA